MILWFSSRPQLRDHRQYRRNTSSIFVNERLRGYGRFYSVNRQVGELDGVKVRLGSVVGKLVTCTEYSAPTGAHWVYIGRILNNMASHLHYLVQGGAYLLSQIMCGIAIASYGCGLRHVRCRSFCKHWFETHMARESFIKNQPLGPTRPVFQLLEIDSSYRWEMLTKCVN